MRVSSLVIFGLILSAVVVVATTNHPIPKPPAEPDFYLDPSKENVKVSFDEAKSIAEKSLPTLKNANLLHEGLVYDKLSGKRVWELKFVKDGKHISVCIDANSGEVIYLWDESKMSPSGGIISEREAERIANSYLESREKENNLVLSSVVFNPSEEKAYGPKYDVHYSRLIKGIPCLSDGITVSVNANSGEVVAYYKVWTIPEGDCTNSEPTLAEEDARNILKSYMEREYSTEIDILSSKLVWMDLNYPAEGSEKDVRLAWWLEFEDAHLKKIGMPPASAWIDAHSGDVLKVVYDIG